MRSLMRDNMRDIMQMTRRFSCCFWMLVAILPAAPVRAQGPAQKPPVQLSSPYERMLREQIANGRALPQAVIDRFGLGVALDEGGPAEAPAAEHARPFGSARAQAISLGPDHQANNSALDVSCVTTLVTTASTRGEWCCHG